VSNRNDHPNKNKNDNDDNGGSGGGGNNPFFNGTNTQRIGIIAVLVIGIMMLLVFTSQQQGNSNRLPLNELAVQVAAGEVKTITVRGGEKISLDYVDETLPQANSYV